MEEPDRNEAGDERRSVEAAGYESITDPAELRARLEVKDGHVRELYEEITRFRLAADEARAARGALEERVRSLEEERERLRERVRELEREERGRWRRRESQERRISRLEREVERRDEKLDRQDGLLRRKEEEIRNLEAEIANLRSGRERALEEALRTVEGLQRDLEERESEADELRSEVRELEDRLEEERERHRRLAEPENRLRAGIELFNSSVKMRTVRSISKSFGRPEVRAELGEGEEPPVLITFRWPEISRQTYAANPGLAVEEPRVYLKDEDEDEPGSGVKPPNARVGPDGRVALGL